MVEFYMVKFKLGSPRNLSLLILIAILIWLATGFYRVEPDEQGVELFVWKMESNTHRTRSSLFLSDTYWKGNDPKS